MRQRFRQARADITTMRRVFPEAERLARAAGRTEPGPDDLVLAGLDLPDGIARRALARCGVSPRALRTATSEVRTAAALDADPTDPSDPADARPTASDAALDGPPKGVYRSEPSMQMTFHVAVGLAKADRSHVRSRDLLLAALQSPDGVVTRALGRLGVDPAAVRDAVAGDDGS